MAKTPRKSDVPSPAAESATTILVDEPVATAEAFNLDAADLVADPLVEDLIQTIQFGDPDTPFAQAVAALSVADTASLWPVPDHDSPLHLTEPMQAVVDLLSAAPAKELNDLVLDQIFNGTVVEPDVLVLEDETDFGPETDVPEIAAPRPPTESKPKVPETTWQGFSNAHSAQSALTRMGLLLDEKLGVLGDVGQWWVPQVRKGHDLFYHAERQANKETLLNGLAKLLKPIPGVSATVVDGPDVLLLIQGPRWFLDPLAQMAGSPIHPYAGLPEFAGIDPFLDPLVETTRISSVQNYRAKRDQAAAHDAFQAKDKVRDAAIRRSAEMDQAA